MAMGGAAGGGPKTSHQDAKINDNAQGRENSNCGHPGIRGGGGGGKGGSGGGGWWTTRKWWYWIFWRIWWICRFWWRWC